MLQRVVAIRVWVVFALGWVAVGGAHTAHAQPPDTEAPEAPSWTLDDGVRVRTADARLEMRFGLAASLRASLVDTAGKRSGGFAAHYVRPVWSGYAIDRRVRFFVQPELAGDARLLDAELSVLAWPALGVRLGRFRTQFSRQFVAPIIQLALTERSFVSDWFRADRDVGVALEGALSEGTFQYAAGIYDGTLNVDGRRDRPLWVMRLVVSPWAAVALDETVASRNGAHEFGLEIGLAATRGPLRTRNWQANAEGQVPDGRRTALGLEVALEVARVSVRAEAFLAELDPTDLPSERVLGGFAQAAVGLWASRLDAVARYNVLDLDGGATAQRVELGANGYVHGHVLKLQAHYGLDRFSGDASGLRLPVVADGHRGVVQVQLAL